ncbi:hypothetical protein ANN_27626 [Periplaneta americana]|uniref:C2H2-type domain-containing protein n=1 Tax=Periplaneta americana TaxID=6978 RepID=A0ABQ8RWA7_PERAM|nr:hypothetical protein ANN_27626 [Periplaneta americana]
MLWLAAKMMAGKEEMNLVTYTSPRIPVMKALWNSVAMDVVKMEPETDPLDIQLNEDTDMKERKPLLEEWNSSNPQQVCMKAEYEDSNSYLTSEVKTEQMLMPDPFPLKCESQEDPYDVDRVKEEQSLEVKTEEDEFLSESIVNSDENETSLLKKTSPKNCISFENLSCDSTSEVQTNEETLGSENSYQKEGVRGKDKSSFKCHICGLFLNTAFRHKVHIRSHSAETKHFKCDICGKRFSRASMLREHVRTHTGEKPYKCEICGKCFSHSSSFKVHKLVHTGEKQFRCDSCGKCFSRSAVLKEHVRTHTGEKPHKCDVCAMRFSHSGYLNHLRTHTGEKPFKCQICEKSFSHAGSLKDHSRTHTGEKPFKCEVVVITEDVQNVHLLLEYRPHIDVSLTCEHDPKLQEYCTSFCDSTFLVTMNVLKMESETDPLDIQLNEDTDIKERKPLLEEWNSSNPQQVCMKAEYEDHSSYLTSEVKTEQMLMPIPFPLKCEAKEEFYDVDRVKEEQSLEVKTEENEFLSESIVNSDDNETSLLKKTSPKNCITFVNVPCDNTSELQTCEQINESQKSFETEGVRRRDKSLFKCHICGLFLNTASRHKAHIRSHSAETKEFKCNVCGKSFARRRTLREHLRTHTGEKAYKCDVCGMCFSHSGSLRVHKSIHSEEKQFKCVTCGRCFLNSVALRDHLRTHTVDEPFKCEICGQCFSHARSLNAHKRIHTGKKQFICGTCGKNCSRSVALTEHMRTHTGEKPYKCQICEKSFSHAGYLPVHARSHTGEKPFKCVTCGKCFSISRNLRYHEEKHANEKQFKCCICGESYSLSKSLRYHDYISEDKMNCKTFLMSLFDNRCLMAMDLKMDPLALQLIDDADTKDRSHFRYSASSRVSYDEECSSIFSGQYHDAGTLPPLMLRGGTSVPLRRGTTTETCRIVRRGHSEEGAEHGGDSRGRWVVSTGSLSQRLTFCNSLSTLSVVMDAIKVETEVDPLAIQASGDTDTEDKSLAEGVSRAMHDGTSKLSEYSGQHLWSVQVQEIHAKYISELFNSFLVAFCGGSSRATATGLILDARVPIFEMFHPSPNTAGAHAHTSVCTLLSLR